MSEKDRDNLLGILDSCAKIQRFTEEMNDADAFYADERTFDAVRMNFVVIGESAGASDFHSPNTEYRPIR